MVPVIGAFSCCLSLVPVVVTCHWCLSLLPAIGADFLCRLSDPWLFGHLLVNFAPGTAAALEEYNGEIDLRH